MIILLLYTSLITITQIINVEKPTFKQYSHLYSKYSQTLTCPCTHISVNYGKFLHIQYTLHQICSSIFITDNWISHNDAVFINLYINNDPRMTVSYAFQGLSAFCELVKNTIYNSLIQFNSTEYITASVASLELFDSQTQSFINQFRSSTTNSFLLSLNMTRKITQGNAFLSGQLTNYNLKITDDNNRVTATTIEYSGCNCHLSNTCIKQLTLYDSVNNNTFFDVPGLFTGCYVIEALLQSNLQCFYEQTCIDKLQTYLSNASAVNATALGSSLLRQYFPNTTIENILYQLMIEEWNSTRLYHQYYNECQPKQCSYTIERRKSIVYIISKMFGIVGGLITILRCIIPRLVKFVRKKKNQSSRSTFSKILENFKFIFLSFLLVVVLYTYIPHLFSNIEELLYNTECISICSTFNR